MYMKYLNYPLTLAARPLPRPRAAELKAEDDTDELYKRILLLPIVPGSGEVLGRNQTAPLVPGSDKEAEVEDGEEASSAKTASYTKVLTQSDANNGGGFSVPRHCADTVFPALEYAADPPMQDLAAYDVHGKVWNFRHIYRGTPRRHLITSGWSAFVNRKGLVAGDSLLFHRISNGDIGVGIRRALRRATTPLVLGRKNSSEKLEGSRSTGDSGRTRRKNAGRSGRRRCVEEQLEQGKKRGFHWRPLIMRFEKKGELSNCGESHNSPRSK